MNCPLIDFLFVKYWKTPIHIYFDDFHDVADVIEQKTTNISENIQIDSILLWRNRKLSILCGTKSFSKASAQKLLKAHRRRNEIMWAFIFIQEPNRLEGFDDVIKIQYSGRALEKWSIYAVWNASTGINKQLQPTNSECRVYHCYCIERHCSAKWKQQDIFFGLN